MEFGTTIRDLDLNKPEIVAMVLLFVASLISAADCLLLVFLGRTGPRHRTLKLCAFMSTILFAAGFGVAIHTVHNARQALLDSYQTARGTSFFESLDIIEPVLSVVGAAMGIFSALGALTLLLLARRSSQIRARIPIGLFVTCFLLCFVTAVGIGLRLSPLGNPPPITALMDPDVLWAIQHGDQVLAIARRSVLSIAIFATIVISVQAFRNRSMSDGTFGSCLWILGIITAAIGTHAWLTTRPLAFDARNPLPPPREGPVALCPDTSLDIAKLPRAATNDTTCSTYDFWYTRLGLVELGTAGAKLNGEFATTPEQLAKLAQNQFESHSTFHDRHVIVASDATIPDSEVARWIGFMPPPIFVTRLMGYDEPARQRTHTAGLVPRRLRCACRPVDRPSP
jgi:hypothetical protein